MKHLNNHLETLFETNQFHLIQIARSLLDTEGIDSFVFDENINHIYGGAFGGYKLKVNVNDLKNAKKILKRAQDENNLHIV